MHVHMTEYTFNKLKKFVESFEYYDYDKEDVVIEHTISYHEQVCAYSDDFIDTLCKFTDSDTLNNIEIKNKFLIRYYDKLSLIYESYALDEMSQCPELVGNCPSEIIDYVLYRMNVTDITTLILNLYGIRKLSLDEY